MDLRLSECMSAKEHVDEFYHYVVNSFSKRSETYGELVSNLEHAKELLIRALRSARAECAKRAAKEIKNGNFHKA